MLKIDPGDVSTKDWHQYMLGAVAPRPIAFVSTIDEDGVPNLAPYSYFNAFSSNPPVLAFSVANKSNPAEFKDTLKNIKSTGEAVINIVSYKIVRQMVITSLDYPTNVDEFEKSGLTPIPSDLIKPFRVKESLIQFECKVQQIIPMGTQGGAGNLVICDVLRLHISKDILNEKNRIDPHKADNMGRLGRAYYVRASGESIYTIFQSRNQLGIGYDSLPNSTLASETLTANNLGHLAGLNSIPNDESLDFFKQDPHIKNLIQSEDPTKALHLFAKKELEKEQLESAALAVWLAQHLIDEKSK